jgi:uncharacterized membrane protein YgaE (UPF0421/DUF939 family)
MASAQQAVDLVAELGQKGAATVAARLGRVRASLLLAIQAGVAAGIAWYLASDVLGNPSPFFAPISAVIVLGVAVGQRLRRAIELVAGVTLGVAVGDLLIYAIGTGWWQIGLVVILAILAAVFLGGSSILVAQCASSSVLVATVVPPTAGIYYARVVDALIGGVVGVLVMAILLPVNPLTTVRKAAGHALGLLEAELDAVADAVSARDVTAARETLGRIRASEGALTRFRDALAMSRETASLAPVRWRSRAPIAQYVDGAIHIDRAIRNARVLARRAVSMLEGDEPVPATMTAALRELADAVVTLRRELAAGAEPVKTQEQALRAAAEASAAYRGGLGFSGIVVVAQIRSIATDLLRASGLDESTSTRAVRRAVGRLKT